MELTEDQADGVACAVCGENWFIQALTGRPVTPHVRVRPAPDGTPLYACTSHRREARHGRDESGSDHATKPAALP